MLWENHLIWERMRWRDWESSINILPENSSTTKQEHYNDVWRALGDLFFKEVQVQPRFDVRVDYFISFFPIGRIVQSVMGQWSKGSKTGDTCIEINLQMYLHPPTRVQHKQFFL